WFLLVTVFAHENFEQSAHLAMLLGLRIDPVADHLLLAAHVMHQTLDRFCEIGHGGGGCPRAPIGNGFPQPLDCYSQVARYRARSGRGDVAAHAEVTHGGGEPILELGIEAVLRLAALEAEDTRHEGAGEP